MLGSGGDGQSRVGAHHFVGEDAIDAVVVQVDEPVEALQLVFAHFARDHAGLLVQPVAEGGAVALLQQLCILLLLRVLVAVAALGASPATNRVSECTTRHSNGKSVHPASLVVYQQITLT